MSNRNPVPPLISIIVAVHNGAETIRKCIESVSTQSFSNKELIVIDGGSKDVTVTILQETDNFIDYWSSEPDRGIAHAWNKGLAQATGKWVLFLGADDYLNGDEALASIAGDLEHYASCDLIYGRIIFSDGINGGLVVGSEYDHKRFQRRMTIPHTAAFHRRKLFDKIGIYDEHYKIALDYELLLRKKDLRARYVDRLITIMGGSGMSSKFYYRSLREGLAAKLKNKVDSKLKLYIWYLVLVTKLFVSRRTWFVKTSESSSSFRLDQ